MRVCLVYDHLYPATIGGGERWMHDLALALVGDGHNVTYLTMRHWEHEPPELPGVEVVGLVPAGAIYTDERRTLWPPARFGLAVGGHLTRHGKRYDVVHTAAFPFFPLIAAGLVRRRAGFRLVADWYEVWTRPYWQRYAGRVVGTAGWLVQRRCVRTPHRAFCISRLTERRLLEEGFRGEHSVLPGLYAGRCEPSTAANVEPVVVFAGRIVGEKRVPLLVHAIADARRSLPQLRLEVFGDGPDRAHAETETRRLGLDDHVMFRGRGSQDDVEAAFASAACVATASEREGYGLIIVEAAARGTPSVVVAGEENASVELVVNGVNGQVAAEATPASLGAAIVEVIRQGDALRASTLAWFEQNANNLTLERSLDVVTASYGRATT